MMADARRSHWAVDKRIIPPFGGCDDDVPEEHIDLDKCGMCGQVVALIRMLYVDNVACLSTDEQTAYLALTDHLECFGQAPH